MQDSRTSCSLWPSAMKRGQQCLLFFIRTSTLSLQIYRNCVRLEHSLMHHWPWELGEFAFISGTDFFDHSFRILYQLLWHHWLFFLLHSRVIIDLKESLRERQKSGFDSKKHYGTQRAFCFVYVYKPFLPSYFYSWGNRVLPRLDVKAPEFALQPVFCITNAQIGRHSGKKNNMCAWVTD